MATLDFQTAAQAEIEKDAGDVVILNGRSMTVKKPKTAALGLAQSAMRKGDPSHIIAVFLGMFPSREDREFITALMEDAGENFDLYDEDPEVTSVMSILKALLAHWSGGRPTEPRAASKPSRSTTGRTSPATARRRASATSTSTTPTS